MSTAIPGRHIEGMVRAFAHTDPSVPAGFTAETWRTYLEDPDGGRAPFRDECPATFAYPFTTPDGIEAASWDMPAKGDDHATS